MSDTIIDQIDTKVRGIQIATIVNIIIIHTEVTVQVIITVQETHQEVIFFNLIIIRILFIQFDIRS